MASSAIHGGGERDFTVANATELALDNRRHGDGIAALLGQEDGGMAIGAGQPLRMRLVGETHIGHGAGVLEDDVEIHGEHHLLAGEALPGLDQILVQHLDPIDDAGVVPGEIHHGLRRIRQDLYGVIGGIMNAVFGERDDLSLGLKMQASAPHRTAVIILGPGIAPRQQT